MILRRVQLTQFDGLRACTLGPFPDSGAAVVSLPEGCSAEAIPRALTFALRGRSALSGSPLDESVGYTFVELHLRGAGGEELSLFRGLDRNGREQVSLREAGRRGALSGAESVAARLDAVLGAPASDWLSAALAPSSAAGPGAVAPEPSGGAAPTRLLSGEQVAALRGPVRQATDALRRAGRAVALEQQAEAALAALVGLAARLRRERSETSVTVTELTAERERRRARLRRIEEYHALVQQGELLATDGGGPADVHPRTRIALAVLTAVFASVVLWTVGRGDLDLAVLATIGFVVAFVAFLLVAFRRPDGSTRLLGQVDARDAWRQALRRRFQDVGDPDRPELPEELRTEIAEIERRLAPLQAALETLDDLLAVADVELGRACRALRRSLPEPREAPTGLTPDESLDAAAERLARRGDDVYRLATERDAVTAAGVQSVPDAVRGLRGAVLAFADELDVGAAARDGLPRLAWERLTGGIDGDFAATVSDLATSVERFVDGLERLAARETVPDLDPQAVARQAARELLGDPSDGTTDAVATVLAGDLRGWTEEQWDGVALDSAGRLVLTGPAGNALLAGLPRARRDRLAFGLRRLLVERAAPAGPCPRLFRALPAGFAGRSDVAAYLTALRGAPVQAVFFGAGLTLDEPATARPPAPHVDTAPAATGPAPTHAEPPLAAAIAPAPAPQESVPADDELDDLDDDLLIGVPGGGALRAPTSPPDETPAPSDETRADATSGEPLYRPRRGLARRFRRLKPRRLDTR